jgi:hypothetical protein
MISILKQALGQHPFQPITVVTSDGASVIIKNAEFAAVLRKAGLLYIELPEEPEPRFISLRLIKKVRAKDLTPHDMDEDSNEE